MMSDGQNPLFTEEEQKQLNAKTSLQATLGYFEDYMRDEGFSLNTVKAFASDVRLLGFRLPVNFRAPYTARTMSDFWRRWHISLSTWLRDYLYITLGGSRQGKMRTYVNLAVTMLLGGLWHGASWNFVLWGGLHGTYLAVHRAFIQGRREAGGLATKALSMAFTFTLVSFTWLPFRLQEPSAVFDYLRGVFAFSADGFGSLVVVAVLYGLILLVDIPQAVTDDEYWLLQWRLVPRLAMTGATIVAIVLAAGGQAAPFIYFQF